MGRPRKVDDEIVVRSLARGVSAQKLAEILKVSIGTIYHAKKRYDLRAGFGFPGLDVPVVKVNDSGENEP